MDNVEQTQKMIQFITCEIFLGQYVCELVFVDGVIGSSDPKVIVDQESNLSAAKETVFFLSFHFVQTDHFLEAGIIDDSVQC